MVVTFTDNLGLHDCSLLFGRIIHKLCQLYRLKWLVKLSLFIFKNLTQKVDICLNSNYLYAGSVLCNFSVGGFFNM
jgi:hypothetical protein